MKKFRGIFTVALPLGLGLALLAGCGKSSDPLKSGGKITGSASDAAVGLKVCWSPTNRYFYRVETTLYNDIITKSKAVPVAQETSLALEYSLQITRTNVDGRQQFDLEILSAALNLTRNGELLVSYDTDNRAFMLDDANFSETLRNLKGAHLTCVLSPSNVVERLDGVPALLARIGGGKPAALKTVTYLRSASMLRGMITDQFFRQLVDWSFFPEDPVRIGRTWPARRQFATNPMDGGTAAADLTCVFKGWQQRGDDKCMVVDFSGNTRGMGRPAKGILGFFSSAKPSQLSGRLWLHGEKGVPMALLCGHESSFQYSAARTQTIPPPKAAGTNAPPAAPGTNMPAGPTQTLATRQHTVIELLEIGPRSTN